MNTQPQLSARPRSLSLLRLCSAQVSKCRSLSLSPALSIVEGKCPSILAALCLAWGGQGRAVVVTHDPRVAELADRVARIEDGRIAR